MFYRKTLGGERDRVAELQALGCDARARLTVKFGGWEYFAKVKRRHH